MRTHMIGSRGKVGVEGYETKAVVYTLSEIDRR